LNKKFPLNLNFVEYVNSFVEYVNTFVECLKIR